MNLTLYRLILVAAFCLFRAVASVGQQLPATPNAFTATTPSCGTDDYHQKRMLTDTAYLKFVQNAKMSGRYQLNSQGKGARATPGDNSILTIPVVFVVYHLGEPVGQGSNVSDAALQGQINLLNKFYSTTSGGTTDTRIRFAMARRTSDCVPFNGVHRIDARGVAGYEVLGVDYNNFDIQQRLSDLAGPAINQMGERAIIVRVYWRVTGAGGWASYGGEVNAIPAPSTVNPVGFDRTLAHEVGHVLFLKHTFEGSNGGTCPSNVNPLTDGDEVADTPPHRQNEPACSSISDKLINTCTGQSFGSVGRNLMSYGCGTYIITPGQTDRMRGYLGASLSRFVDSPYLFPPTTNQVPVAACVPSSGVSTTVSSAHQEGIRQIRLGIFQRQTVFSSSQPLLYQPFDCQLLTPVLQPGQSYTIAIDAPYNNTHRRVYVDWNNDGTFNEATERAFSSSIGEDVGTINVPANASTAQALRVRVLVCDGTQPPTACYVPTLGAAMDFALRVEPVSSPLQLQLGQLNSLSYCSGQAVLLPYTLNAGYDLNTVTVQAELSDASGTFGTPVLLKTGTGGLLTAQLPANLLPGSGYRIRLTANGALQPVQTPLLTIRQTPSGYLTTPTTTTTIIGRPFPFSIVLTGSGPWRVYNYFATESSFYINVKPTIITSATSANLGPTQWLGTMQYEITSIEDKDGCLATATGVSQSATVSCSPPESLTETEKSTTSVRLKWDELTNTTFYVQWKAAAASIWTDLPPQMYVGAYLNNLTYGSSYNWRVAMSCPNSQTSVYSPPRTFTLTCPLPDQLYEVLTPTSALLNWSPMGNNYSNELRWRTLGSANWTTVSPQSFYSYNLSGVVAGQSYQWQVRNSCSNGVFSDWTDVRTFTVSCAPLRSAYITSVGSTTAMIGWGPVIAGIQYRARWRLQGTTNWTVVGPVTASELAIVGLPSGSFIDYEVQSICADGSVSPYSATQSFRTYCIPTATPTLLGVTASSALITYTPLPSYEYTLFWRDINSQNWNTVAMPTEPATTFKLTGLVHNTTYELYIYTFTSGNYTCNITPTITFTTVNCPLPGVTSIIAPTTAVSGLSISMTVSLTGTSPYAFTLTNGDSFSGIGSSPFSFTTTYKLPDNYSGLQITNQVVKLSTSCGTIYYPSPKAYTNVYQNCFPTPTNLRFEGQISSNTVLLTWENINTQHRLRWRATGNPTWTTTTIYGNTYYLNGVVAGQSYEWQLEAFCTYGQSGYSPTQTFTVPTCPQPYQLRESTSPTAARLAWYYSVTSSQTVRWRMAGQTAWNSINNLYGIYTLNGLTANTAYEWQVQLVCQDGSNSGYTPIRSFTTVCGSPESPGYSNVTSTSATINLSTLSGVQYVLRYRNGSGPGSWLTNPALLTSSPTPLTGLTASSSYDVQLQAVCAGGQRSPFSESSSIYTSCQTATATLGSNSTISPGQTATLMLTYVGGSPLSATINTGTAYTYLTYIQASPYPVVVSPSSTTTYTLERVSNACGVGVVQGSPTTVTIGTCLVMQTVMAGYWNNPAIWSCGRIPTSTDVVTLRHIVTVPGPSVLQVLRVRYGPGGRLFYQPSAQLRANP